MMIARIIEIFSPHSFLSFFRARKLKKHKRLCRRRIETLDVIKNKFLSWAVDFPFLYARTAYAIGVVLAFSSGIPILYPIVFCFTWQLYRVERNFFIEHSQTPKKIEEHLIFFLLKVISFGLILHLIVSLFAYSNQELFPAEAQANIFGKFYL